jgi:septal ring factor EnvC (AmiA/AmiB activator)
MKAGHYYNQAEKAYKILHKYHTKMFDLGGEESDFWNDDLNHYERVLRDSLDWGKEDELFTEAANFDTRLSRVDDHIKEYLSDIRYLKGRIKELKATKERVQQEKKDYLVENNMDYKTIDKRLATEYPEFVEETKVETQEGKFLPNFHD